MHPQAVAPDWRAADRATGTSPRPRQAHAWARPLAWVAARARPRDRAKEEAEDRLGWALYLDLHGHGHSQQRLELGYLLSASALAADDNTLASLLPQASVADLARRTEVSFPELIRGSSSLGSLLQDRNVRAVPSSAEPNPAGEPYFSGGYSTARHGSRDGGAVSGIQLELHWEGLRDSAENRAAFAERLVAAVDSFLVVHEGAGWSGGPASP